MDLSAGVNAKVNSANFKGMNTAETLDELVHHYDQWAPNYDAEVATFGHKKQLVVDEVKKFAGNRRDIRILDVASGTGLTGEMLKNEGFNNVDALDPSQEMLKVAGKKEIYKNLICDYVEKGHRLAIEDNTYDAQTIVGGLGTNHMKEDCFEELSRISKPGGIIVSITPVHALGNDKERASFEATMQRNHDNGMLLLVDTIHVPVYYNGTDGLMHIFKKPTAK